MLSQLEGEGLIARTPDPSDKRAVLLSATKEGLELERKVHAVRSQRGDEYFATLGAEDRAELTRLLGLLLEAHPRRQEGWRLPRGGATPPSV